MKRNVFTAIIISLLFAFSLSGCVEHHYYEQNHRHTDGYYHRHHRTPPKGLQIDIHN